MSDDVSLLDKLEDALKAGNLILVHDELNRLNLGKINRKHVVKFANIARRAGYHRTAIRFLHPIVRSATEKATGAEKAEYAMCLSRAGASAEAHTLLNEVDPSEDPESLLYKAFCYFGSWDYQLSIPLLKKYLENQNLKEHQRIVAQINLADAYFAEGLYSESQKLCEQLLKKFDSEKQRLHTGYVHLILGQTAVLTQKFDVANKHFSQVENFIGESHYRYHLYLRKWRGILECYKNPCSQSEQDLIAVAEQAQAKRVWEVARDCDFYRALIFKKENLFWQVYFATPYAHYRERMLNVAGFRGIVPESFDFAFNEKAGTPTRVFHVREGAELGTLIKLKAGSLVYRLLAILASDFYRSFRVETLFSLLFPDELYNIKKSSYKVHDTMSRLRQWLLESNLPFTIDEDDSHYRLRVSEPFILRLTNRETSKSNIAQFVDGLKNNFGVRTFKVQDVIGLSSHPRSTAKWLLSRAVEEGLLERVGQGRGVKYKLAA